MAANIRRAVSNVTQLPTLTAGNIALALLALPLFILFLGIFNLDIHPIVSIGIQWTLAAVVVGIAISGEGLSLADLGFRQPSWIDLGYTIVTSVVILVIYSATSPIVEALGLPVQTGATSMGVGAGIGVALARAVTTGIVEEVLYRGYPIERLLAYTESPFVAGGLTWGVFTAVHAINWPLGNLLQTALVAALLTVVYLRRRTLAPVVGAHVLVWVVAVLGQVYG